MICCHPDEVYPKIVREFYSHITIDIPFVYVWGISILFDVDKINDYFGLYNVKDEHAKFAKGISEEGLDKVLQDLCVPGTIWDKSKTDQYMIERNSLNIWVSFLKTRLMPIVHITTVGKRDYFFFV